MPFSTSSSALTPPGPLFPVLCPYLLRQLLAKVFTLTHSSVTPRSQQVSMEPLPRTKSFSSCEGHMLVENCDTSRHQWHRTVCWRQRRDRLGTRGTQSSGQHPTCWDGVPTPRHWPRSAAHRPISWEPRGRAGCWGWLSAMLTLHRQLGSRWWMWRGGQGQERWP